MEGFDIQVPEAVQYFDGDLASGVEDVLEGFL